MEHQEVDLSAFYQLILQSTTVTSDETCASINTIGVKRLCVFLQLIALESNFTL